MIKKTLSLAIHLLIGISAYTQTPVISERNQLFIDFLKQEKQYHSGIGYFAWPFENIRMNNTSAEIKLDSTYIREQVLSSIFFNPDYQKIDYSVSLPLSHRISIQAENDSIYNAQVEVAVPDSMCTLNFNLEEIGQTKKFDLINITLLQVESNVAYLLLEDKSDKYNYSYTKTGYRNTDDDREKTESESADSLLGYWDHSDSFFNNYIIRCPEEFNKGYDNAYQIMRINKSVFGSDDNRLYFDSFTEDFRHYLYYRNMDMPYLQMLGAYRELKQRYKEENPSANNHYHPLYVIRIQASGNIEKMQMTVLSRSRHSLELNLKQQKRDQFLFHTKQSGISADFKNETSESIAKKIKVVQYAFYPSESKTFIIAYLPISYNTMQGASLYMDDLQLIDTKGDTIPLYEVDRNPYLNESYFMNLDYAYSFAKAIILIPRQKEMTLIGNIRYDYPNFDTKRYDISDLPEGIHYVGNELFVDKSCGISPFGSELYAYDKNGQMIPVEYDHTNSQRIKIICKYPVAYVLIVDKGESVEGEIPFKLPLSLSPNL